MTARAFKWFLVGVTGLMTSCAFITVNVYFPEKEVKKAFKTLDEKYLKQEGEPAPPVEKPPEGSEPGPATRGEDDQSPSPGSVK